jgi:hypothetical protein
VVGAVGADCPTEAALTGGAGGFCGRLARRAPTSLRTFHQVCRAPSGDGGLPSESVRPSAPNASASAFQFGRPASARVALNSSKFSCIHR